MNAVTAEVPRVPAEKVRNGKVHFSSGEVPIGCVPFIAEGLVSAWPAYRDWTLDNLTTRIGDEEVTCFVTSKDDKSFLQQVNESVSLTFAEFLKHVYGKTESPKLHYLRIDTENPLFERLADDFEIPQWVERYNPAATGIWIGQKGNLTPFHHDWWHSFLAQVSGHKRYTLIHPCEGRTIQKGWSDAAKYDLSPAPYLSPDDPKYQELSVFFEGRLNPGEILYIPPYWFHQVETLDNGNISMPLRFDTDQTTDVPLFQFSQDSVLRTTTNQKDLDDSTLISRLKENREHFFEKEEAFIKAYVRVRNSKLTVDKIHDAL